MSLVDGTVPFECRIAAAACRDPHQAELLKGGIVWFIAMPGAPGTPQLTW